MRVLWAVFVAECRWQRSGLCRWQRRNWRSELSQEKMEVQVQTKSFFRSTNSIDSFFPRTTFPRPTAELCFSCRLWHAKDRFSAYVLNDRSGLYSGQGLERGRKHSQMKYMASQYRPHLLSRPQDLVRSNQVVSDSAL